MSSYAHVVHTTAKQVISRRGKNENICKMSKNESARAKRAKLLFFIAKYANLWRSCCRRRRGCLCSLQSKLQMTGSRVVEGSIENKIFTLTVMCSHYRKALKFQNLTSSFGRLRETIRLWWCCTYGTHLNTVDYSACRTWSTIISLHSTNHIIDFYRCRCLCRLHLFNSQSLSLKWYKSFVTLQSCHVFIQEMRRDSCQSAMNSSLEKVRLESGVVDNFPQFPHTIHKT